MSHTRIKMLRYSNSEMIDLNRKNRTVPAGIQVPTSFKKTSFIILGILVILGILAYYWKTRT